MRRRRQDLAQPSDIAFLLIIFFLLLSGIEVSKSLDLQSGTNTHAQAESISLVIYGDGLITKDAQQTSLVALEGILNSQTSLSVFVETDTTWQAVVDVLSLAQRKQVASTQVELLI
jgi:biopolymer transport protein ExbD